MITSKKQLIEYLEQDAKASKHNGIKPRMYGDEIWKYQYSMRMLDYVSHSKNGLVGKIRQQYWKFCNHHYAVKLGFSISNRADIGKGFSIAHYGSIVIHGSAVIGTNCRIHEGVCIGATNGGNQAAIIGDNVFIGTGAKIIGALKIANDVAIGANAVVVKDIAEPGTSWGGYQLG
jgi:serine O-acetyltransferase